ncbi:MAG: C-GCAxxG-C-C family protein [Defluviitaleaceae bacterium]|nr:C-GCAxxG-C-C family protein [Defluviitaleaceae bacterium]
MKTSVNIQQVRYDAEEVFRMGGFYCSEAIISAIRKNFDPDMPKDFIRAASGFPVGIGRSKCMCGAISGAVLALGYFFGKDREKSMRLTHEMQNSFRQNHKNTLCCHIHVAGMDLASGEHKKQCVVFTGECAAKAAEIIARELNISLTYNRTEVR